MYISLLLLLVTTTMFRIICFLEISKDKRTESKNLDNFKQIWSLRPFSEHTVRKYGEKTQEIKYKIYYYNMEFPTR